MGHRGANGGGNVLDVEQRWGRWKDFTRATITHAARNSAHTLPSTRAGKPIYDLARAHQNLERDGWMKLDGKGDSGLQDRDAFDMLDNAWTPRGVSICGVCATGGGSPPPPLPSPPHYAFTRLPL